MPKLTEEHRKMLWSIAKTQPRPIFASDLNRIVGQEFNNDQCREALRKFKLLKRAEKNNAPRRHKVVHDFVIALPLDATMKAKDLALKFKIRADTAYQILETHKRLDRVMRKPRCANKTDGDKISPSIGNDGVRYQKPVVRDDRPAVYKMMDALRQKYQGGLRIASFTDDL